MNFFKLIRIFYYVEYIKVLLSAAVTALPIWAIAYVALPESFQQYTWIAYWGTFLVAMLAFGRLALRFKKDIDEVVNPAENLFESFSKISSKDPEERKKAAMTLMKTLSELEEDEPDEEVSAEEREANRSRALTAMRKIEIICRNHRLDLARDDDCTLEELAAHYEYHTPAIKNVLALLLPRYNASVWTEVENDEDDHADVMTSLVAATNRELGISNVRSSKNPDSRICTLEFCHHGKDIRWRFRERDHRMSQNFLNKILKYVSDLAGGRFIFIDGEDSGLEYLFVPSAFYEEVVALNKQKIIEEAL